MEKARHRRFTAQYKQQILGEIDRAKLPGEIGAIVRREGLYSSVMSAWRRQRERGELAVLAPRRRGPPKREVHPAEIANASLKLALARADKRAARAEAIIELQKRFQKF